MAAGTQCLWCRQSVASLDRPIENRSACRRLGSLKEFALKTRNVSLRRTMRGVLVLGVALLAGCSLFSRADKRYEPAPLVQFAPEVKAGVRWHVNVGKNAGIGFAPVVVGDAVYAAAEDGSVVKIDLSSGRVLWRASAARRLQAGVGSDGTTTAVVTPSGEVIAFDDTGREIWRAMASSAVLIRAAVGRGRVVVRRGGFRC